MNFGSVSLYLATALHLRFEFSLSISEKNQGKHRIHPTSPHIESPLDNSTCHLLLLPSTSLQFLPYPFLTPVLSQIIRQDASLIRYEGAYASHVQARFQGCVRSGWILERQLTGVLAIARLPVRPSEFTFIGSAMSQLLVNPILCSPVRSM